MKNGLLTYIEQATGKGTVRTGPQMRKFAANLHLQVGKSPATTRTLTDVYNGLSVMIRLTGNTLTIMHKSYQALGGRV